MVENVELTVIVPVYDTEKYIDKCLKSALKATEGLNAEILVVNDGTKDNAGDIAKKYAEDYPKRLIYTEKENGGRADTRNYGLNLAKGNYITFLDSDDYIDNQMYRKMLEEAKAKEADLVVCDMVYEYEDDRLSSYQKCVGNREDLFQSLSDNTLMASPCNKIMKKELFEGLSFPTGENNEDVAVIPVVLGRSERLAYVPEGYYHYVQRHGSAQNSEFSKDRFVIVDVSRMALERIKELSDKRAEILKGSIYVYQILGIPFWQIRKEPFKRRLALLKEYMDIVNKAFPDFHDNEYVREYGKKGKNRMTNVYRSICLNLNRHKRYFLLSVFWSLAKPFAKD